MSKPHGGASTPPYTLLSVTPVPHDFAPLFQVGMISHECMWHLGLLNLHNHSVRSLLGMYGTVGQVFKFVWRLH